MKPPPSQLPPDDACPKPRRPDRRDLLLGLAGGLGFFALSDRALGRTLWLREGAPLAASLPGPTTLTWQQTHSYTLSSTIPETITITGSSSTPKPPGTYTMTAAPYGGGTGTMTSAFPAPGFQTQPVTLAWTDSFSYTPPATIVHTESWRGSVYTKTSSRRPTFMTLTGAYTLTGSYTTLTLDDKDEEPLLVRAPLSAATADPDGEAPLTELDVPGLDLAAPAGRRLEAHRLAFAHAIRR